MKVEGYWKEIKDYSFITPTNITFSKNPNCLINSRLKKIKLKISYFLIF